jgi:hypothetical protein
LPVFRYHSSVISEKQSAISDQQSACCFFPLEFPAPTPEQRNRVIWSSACLRSLPTAGRAIG